MWDDEQREPSESAPDTPVERSVKTTWPCWCGPHPRPRSDLRAYRTAKRFRDDRRLASQPDAGWEHLEPIAEGNLSWPPDRPN